MSVLEIYLEVTLGKRKLRCDDDFELVGSNIHLFTQVVKLSVNLNSRLKELLLQETHINNHGTLLQTACHKTRNHPVDRKYCRDRRPAPHTKPNPESKNTQKICPKQGAAFYRIPFSPKPPI